MRIDPKFVELTADVLEIFLYNIIFFPRMPLYTPTREMDTMELVALEAVAGDNDGDTVFVGIVPNSIVEVRYLTLFCLL